MGLLTHRAKSGVLGRARGSCAAGRETRRAKLRCSTKRAIAVLKRGGSLAEAARAAGVGRDTLWEWRKKDADLAARAEEAMGVGIDQAEDTLTVCAQQALTNPVQFSQLRRLAQSEC